MVELAFVLTPLLAIFFAIIDFSMVVFIRSNFQNAVREGVRYGITFRTQSGLCQDASVREIVKSNSVGFLGSSNQSLIKVNYYQPSDLSTPITSGGNVPGNVIEVSVQGYQVNWLAPLWRSSNPLQINVYASDRLEGLPGGVAPPCR